MKIPPKTKPRIFLIDAYALIYRSYFAFIQRPLTNAAGENTSAPFGFTRFLLDIREDFAPDYLAVVFDAGDSFRTEVFPEYKATREKMPDDLRSSLGRIRDIVEAFNDPIVELDGYEADDVIGTLATRARDAGLEAVIVSGDKDFYQLVGPDIHLMNPGRGGATGVAADWVTEENASEKFGIPPSQVVDYLALVGDSSDNIPGARGVGPKTALALLEQHGDIEALIVNAESLKPPRASKSLQENAEAVRLSKRLVTIMTDLDVELDLEALKVGEPNNEVLRDLFVELEFRPLAEKFAVLAQASGVVTPEVERAEVTYSVVDQASDVDRLIEVLRAAGRMAISAEPSTEDPLRGKLVSLGLSVEGGAAWYLPFAHQQPFELTFEGDGPGEVRNLPGLATAEMSGLKALLEDVTVAKVGHDLKRTALTLSREGVELGGVTCDVMVASYVLDPGRRSHALTTLVLEAFSYKAIAYSDVVGSARKKVPFSDAPIECARDFVCEGADLALQLAEHFDEQLDEHALGELMADLEMPLLPILTRMELAGIGIDEDFFRTMRSKLKRELDLIQQDIFKVAGGDFNLNSTQQLRQVLFEKLELPVLKKTKTGPSTDASVLEELAEQGHEVPKLMMEYRELEKLRSTYVEALPQLVNSRTHRIHTSFNQTVAATGRLSSSDPNLQNIPIRTDVGREIRKGFVAAPGTVFLSVDYSQIELRVMAHFSGDEAFVTAFTQGVDVHRQTASVVFGVPIDDVTALMRGQAKTVNFATLYGQGPFSLARQLGITREEAKEFIATYFERFNGVRDFLDAQVEMAREKGYVETLMGRRRYVPELRSGSWNIRQFGERVAQNTPIQGTAADLMKKAMIDVQSALDEAGTGAEMLLQVHDELLLEVPEAEVDAVRELVVSCMEGAVELRVPLVADWGVGGNWYECKG
ncbi:MAG TPA: DNA polymerase I [Gemmatimonadetes bacterium]|nr:DNA polymerase I [Gemmatimonadota bacterium]HIC55472.1 DNA polymerase I [Gemmatimonadota bacterium]HIN51470.1 DNA polymerase I [Gemmatimonadota bacterium]